jgi:AI-2 transport protein TqsA
VANSLSGDDVRAAADGEGSGVTQAEIRRGFPVWLPVVVGVAGTVIAIWGLHAMAGLLGPILLAFVLTVTVHPLPGWLGRKGVPRKLAVFLSVVAADGILIGLALAVVLSLGQLVTVLPQYSAEWADLVDGLQSTLVNLGVGPEEARAALGSVDLSAVVGVFAGLFRSALTAASALVFVLATTMFMCVDAAGLPGRLAASGEAPALENAMSDFARNTRSYLVVTTVFGLLVAVVDAGALWLLGVPLPLLWGLLSFITNYIPNIGFLIGLIPPVLLGLLVGGPGLAVLVIVIYSVVNFVLQSLVQPVFVGDAVGLSITVSFLSVFVWAAILGPLGAVLAVPLSLFVYALVLGQDPDRRWARALVSQSEVVEAEKTSRTHRSSKTHTGDGQGKTTPPRPRQVQADVPAGPTERDVAP